MAAVHGLSDAPDAVRKAVIDGILSFLGEGGDLLAPSDIRDGLQRDVNAAGDTALLDLKERLTTDRGWAYYPPDPLARQLHHLLADRFITPDSDVIGAEHLNAADTKPVIICANHLSYADANVIEVLLHRSGGASLANRLTAVAGPKIFENRQRRFSSLCFGTIKVPQNAEVASDQPPLSGREAAKAARNAIDAAMERLSSGDALLVFPEGTRSRDRTMQRTLAGVSRYLEFPDLRVVPIGLVGSEALFPVDSRTVQPARLTMTIGKAIDAAALLDRAGGNRRLAMDAIGLSIAGLLPPSYRGAYEDDGQFLEARAVIADGGTQT